MKKLTTTFKVEMGMLVDSLTTSIEVVAVVVGLLLKSI
jgi:hypothetical protein